MGNWDGPCSNYASCGCSRLPDDRWGCYLCPNVYCYHCSETFLRCNETDQTSCIYCTGEAIIPTEFLRYAQQNHPEIMLQFHQNFQTPKRIIHTMNIPSNKLRKIIIRTNDGEQTIYLGS